MTKRNTMIIAAVAAATLGMSAAHAQPRTDTRPSPFTYDELGATPSLQLKSLKADAATRADAGKPATAVDASKAAPLTWSPKAQDAKAAKEQPAVQPAAR